MNANIRNLCIIAHIDHGKSTLADRFLEITNTLSLNKIGEQYLDTNPIEKARQMERGVTSPFEQNLDVPAFMRKQQRDMET